LEIAQGPGAITRQQDRRLHRPTSKGKNGLWVQPLDRTTARLLPGAEGASYPFWSPDNKSVAFFTTGKLERVELAGGSPLFRLRDNPRYTAQFFLGTLFFAFLGLSPGAFGLRPVPNAHDLSNRDRYNGPRHRNECGFEFPAFVSEDME